MEEDREITEHDIMQAVAEQLAPQMRQPNQMTVEMLANMGDMSQRAALLRLERLTRAGILEKSKIYDNGFERNAYSPVSGSWQEVLKKIQG